MERPTMPKNERITFVVIASILAIACLALIVLAIKGYLPQSGYVFESRSNTAKLSDYNSEAKNNEQFEGDSDLYDYGATYLYGPAQSKNKAARQLGTRPYNFLLDYVPAERISGETVTVTKVKPLYNNAPVKLFLVATNKKCGNRLVTIGNNDNPQSCSAARPLEGASFSLSKNQGQRAVIMTIYVPLWPKTKARNESHTQSNVLGPWHLAGVDISYKLDDRQYKDRVLGGAEVNRARVFYEEN